jgi:hypothetical protein
VITISGADPNGDVVTVDITIRDGEGHALGRFENLDIRNAVSNRTQFVFAIPLLNANFFTAAMQASVQLRDSDGNVSNIWIEKVFNPDIRAGMQSPLPGLHSSFALHAANKE